MFENLMANLKNGFTAANATRKLVFGDKQLFMYPVLAVIISIILIIALGAIGFSITLLAYGGLHTSIVINGAKSNSSYNATGTSTSRSHGILLLFALSFFVIYILVFFIVIYFTTAMLIAFREYANGKKLGLIDALKRTAPYATRLLEWAIFISTIKAVLDLIDIIIASALRRFGIIGNIIARLLYSIENIALSLIGLFALPVILDEKTGPVETMKASARFIIKNFGETFAGFVYAEIVQYILIAVGAIFLVLAFLTIFTALPGGLITSVGELIALAVVCLIVIAIATTPVGSVLVFIGFLLAAAFHVSGVGTVTVLFIAIGVTIIIIAHMIKYVLFNCFKLIVYDYKTRKVLPKNFDAKLIDNSIKDKYRPRPGSPVSPTANDLNLFGTANKQGNT